MLSAHEAKEISKQNSSVLSIMKDIEKEIEKAAKRGSTDIMYQCQDYVSTGTVAEIISKMRNLYGYTITWSYTFKAFIISW